MPAIHELLSATGLSAIVKAHQDRLFVHYESLFEAQGYLNPEEIGARSTGEPHQSLEVRCDASEYLPELSFPSARPSVMLAERTFWEKAIAAHVYCRQQRVRGSRRSRHWHDLVRLDRAGIASAALRDRELALAVARHQALFFREKDATRQRIDYVRAVSGDLQLVPVGPARDALESDYEAVSSQVLLLDDLEPFESILEACADLEARANRTGTGRSAD